MQNIYADFSESIGAEGVRRLEQYEAVNDKQHPPQPHYCVDIVGVSKNHRGNGCAKQLLREIQSISAHDPRSTGVFLDTELIENVSFYQYLGYELINESDTGDLHSWHLFRPDDK